MKNVFKDIFYYILVWVVLLALFVFIFIILGVQTCETVDCSDDHDDYKIIDELNKIVIMTIRNGFGDLTPPIYDNLAELAATKSINDKSSLAD